MTHPADGPRRLSGAYRGDLADLAATVRYHETDPTAPFTDGLLATLALPRGRQTLIDRSVSVLADGTVYRTGVSSRERDELLQRAFGLPADPFTP